MPQHNDDYHPMHTQHLREMLSKLVKKDEDCLPPVLKEESKQEEQKQDASVQIPLMTLMESGIEPPKSFYAGQTPRPKVKVSKPLGFVKQEDSAVQVESNMELRLNDDEGLIVINKKLNKVIFHIDAQGRQIETPYDTPEKDIL